jgi:hypothetical protein
MAPTNVALLVLTGADVAWGKDPVGKSAQAKELNSSPDDQRNTEMSGVRVIPSS